VRRLVFAVLLLAAAAPLAAQPEVPDGKWWKRPRIAEEIGLTDDQSKQIEGIFVRNRPRLIDLKAELEKKQFDLQQAMEEGRDRRAIEEKIDAVENARKDLQKARALMVLDMKAVLKPRQWDRLREIVRENRERRRRLLEDGRGPAANGRRPNRKSQPR